MNKTVKRFVGPAVMLLAVVAIFWLLAFMTTLLKAVLGEASIWVAVLVGFYVLAVFAFWNDWHD